MNEQVIMNMICPYVKKFRLSSSDFDNIFSMLSDLERKKVKEIIENNGIVIFDTTPIGQSREHIIKNKEISGDSYEDIEIEEEDDKSLNADEFRILYEDVFSDSNESIENGGENNNKSQKIRKVKMENPQIIRLIQQGNKQAEQDLCIKNERLVTKYANIYMKVAGNKLDFEDLKQSGMMALLVAAKKYDFSIGTEFSTYAVFWIKQAITRTIDDEGFTIRIPVHMMERILKVCKYDKFFAYENEYNIRINMISESTSLSKEEVEKCLVYRNQFLSIASLDIPIGEEEDTSLGDYIPDVQEKSVEDQIDSKELHNILQEMLTSLSFREQDVVKLRFGFEDGRDRTLEEIGQQYNISRERVRQIESKALHKLHAKSKKIKDFR